MTSLTVIEDANEWILRCPFQFEPHRLKTNGFSPGSGEFSRYVLQRSKPGHSMNREEGIRRVHGGPSHVVILGAGASIATTLRNPEESGRRLPSMDNFIQVVGLEDLIEEANLGGEMNFEELYSTLHEQNPESELLKRIETRVRGYFEEMSLPEEPTIYDYLVLALRPKDLIATFNWDPFLYQAWCRNHETGESPRLAFLHGNVAIGYSVEDERSGPAGYYSRETGHQYKPTKLLYPVTEKNYNESSFISRQWDRLTRCLDHCKRVTIFGYGAPDTDVEAVSLMKDAWGEKYERNMEQFEIIDIRPEKEITDQWSRFIHSHHYDYWNSYFDSILAKHPRRTGERFMTQFLPTTPDEAFQEPNPVPQDISSLRDLQVWHSPLIEAEERYYSST